MTLHPYDDLEALALGALDEETSRAVLAHADTCPSCAAALSQAMGTVDALEPNDTLSIAGTGLRASDLPPRSPLAERAIRIWRGVAIAATAAALLLVLWSLNTVRTVRSNQPAGPVVPIAALVHSHFLHHALRGNGSAKVIQALDGSWVYLVGDGFAPNRFYSLVGMTGDVGIRIGEGTTDASGQISGYWKQQPHHFDSFQLTVRGSNPLAKASTLHWP